FKLLLGHKKRILQIFLINAFISIAFYLLFVWMPVYLNIFLGQPANYAFLANTFGLLTLIIFTLVVGFVSKNSSRFKWIMLGMMLTIVFSYPLFILLNHQSLFLIFSVPILFAIFLGCIDGVINATMGSLFDDKIRCTGISLGFTLSTAIF